MKKTFLHGLTAGILSALASLVYNSAYASAMMVDFSKVINQGSLIGSSLFGCILASLGYFLFTKYIPKFKNVIFNIVFLVLSFLSFVGPFSVSLPLDIEAPELFIGLTIPMHLFPALFWLASKPLFYKEEE